MNAARRLCLTLPLALTATALHAPALAAVPGERFPEAPDGHRGLGKETSRQELLQLFRTPDEDEESFLAELGHLERDIDVLVDNAVGVYRSRGYLDVLEPALDPTVKDLHRMFRELLRDPVSTMSDEGHSVEFARMFLDTRFRVRMGLLDGWESEADELRHGLAVLDAAANGLVELTDHEAANIAQRVDFSAAALRAVKMDLEALREVPGWPGDTGVDDEAVTRWLALASIEDEEERARGVDASKYDEARRATQMRQMLFTTRLEEHVREELDWRREQDMKAYGHYREALEAWPDDDDKSSGVLAAELRKMSKTERRRRTREKALESLAYDPLDREAAYLAGQSARMVHGTVEALSHYDRFLALDGVRYNDDSTYRRRELTDRQEDALLYIQGARQQRGVLSGGRRDAEVAAVGEAGSSLAGDESLDVSADDRDVSEDGRPPGKRVGSPLRASGSATPLALLAGALAAPGARAKRAPASAPPLAGMTPWHRFRSGAGRSEATTASYGSSRLARRVGLSSSWSLGRLPFWARATRPSASRWRRSRSSGADVRRVDERAAESLAAVDERCAPSTAPGRRARCQLDTGLGRSARR